MLAQNFKSHTDLGVSEKEHRALIKVLGMLERAELAHAPGNCSDTPTMPNGFSMATQMKVGSCGTTACIGGWVAILTQEENPIYYVNQYMERGALQPLYWGNIQPDVTPSQAASALRNFLTTGAPNWKEAVAA